MSTRPQPKWDPTGSLFKLEIRMSMQNQLYSIVSIIAKDHQHPSPANCIPSARLKKETTKFYIQNINFPSIFLKITTATVIMSVHERIGITRYLWVCLTPFFESVPTSCLPIIRSVQFETIPPQQARTFSKPSSSMSWICSCELRGSVTTEAS